MLHVDLETSAGLGSFAYAISTPTDAHATAIVQELPTVLLLHPAYEKSSMFHFMYTDVRLRRFNLVAMDLRGFGETLAKVEATYGREAAARDVLTLMDALGISACHVMGVSMGACVALQMGILAPDKVLSLFLFSPLPLTEVCALCFGLLPIYVSVFKPEESIHGRREIYDCWIQGFKDPDHVDQIALADSLMGGMQMAYNNFDDHIAKVFGLAAYTVGLRNTTPENFERFHTVTVKFFLHREPHSISELARIRCPVSLVHCSEDVVYPRHYAEELLADLDRAGLDANLHTIDGAPHFGNVTHANETNTLLYNFILGNSATVDLSAAPASVESPFLEELIASGLLDFESDDSDLECGFPND
ncbi:Alpha/Beta hydrolase protein [Mycena capillaripes]|nr:Alpha/Beta hydrolase protein [Mycena capillaripes]